MGEMYDEKYCLQFLHFQRLLKVAMFSLFNAAFGLSLSPILFLGGDILSQVSPIRNFKVLIFACRRPY